MSGLKGKLWGLLLVVVSAALLGACGEGDSSGDGSENGTAYQWETEPVAWHLEGRPQGANIRIRVESGYCDGAPEPTIDDVEVIESSGGVAIRVEVREVVVDGVCAGLGLGLTETVQLESPVGDRQIFDSGVAPPERRWPKPR